MPGIILSLLVTLIALSFAFHTDDNRTPVRDEWKDSGWRTLKKTSGQGRGAEGERAIQPDPERSNPNEA